MLTLLLIAIAYHAAASLATFVAYWLDKRAAVRGARRTRERTLHLFELAGGWPGALLAQKWLRHKTYDRSYRPWFWVMVAAHIVIVTTLAAATLWLAARR